MLSHFDLIVSAPTKVFGVFMAVSPTSRAFSANEPFSTSRSREVWARLCWRMQSFCSSFPSLQPNSFQESRWLTLCKLTQRSRVWGIESSESSQICWGNSSYVERWEFDPLSLKRLVSWSSYAIQKNESYGSTFFFSSFTVFSQPVITLLYVINNWKVLVHQGHFIVGMHGQLLLPYMMQCFQTLWHQRKKSTCWQKRTSI